ncbi:MAG: NADH-quinone oxidoreductase subunit C [Thermoplasmata archaeon]|nr:NADH-quinone oxidoreductase subunit C [Thermoplasmata archaeon]
MSDVVAQIQAALGKSVLSVSSPAANRWFLELGDTSAVQTAVEHLARQPATRLITVSCSDYPACLELLYHIDIGEGILTLRVKVWKPSSMNSITAAMPAAELIEHEITELFGLEFTGNPRPNNMILSESQSQLLPLRNRASSLETRMDGNVANIVEHGSTTAPSKRVMKSRSAIGMPENPPLCSVTCPGKNIVFEIAESSGTVSRHPNLKKKEGGQ